jgi:hypothetical protein
MRDRLATFIAVVVLVYCWEPFATMLAERGTLHLMFLDIEGFIRLV